MKTTGAADEKAAVANKATYQRVYISISAEALSIIRL